jgi:hypothetical protein
MNILGRGILYTETLILNDTKNNIVHELKNHAKITAEDDNYDSIFRLNVQFNLADKLVSGVSCELRHVPGKRFL